MYGPVFPRDIFVCDPSHRSERVFPRTLPYVEIEPVPAAPYVEAAVGKGRDVVRGEQILIPVFPQIVVGVVAVVQDRVDEGPRLPFVADERAEYGGLERARMPL